MMHRAVLGFVLFFCGWSCAAAAEDLARAQWTIEGVTREALIYAPAAAKATPSPLIFAFHGHGGTMKNAAQKFALHRHWPEAIVVYPQGLNTPGLLTDPEGKKPGWQKTVGDQNDRDLKLFDAMLLSLKKDYQVDGKRIYATGHSNGGGFTYLLWAARGDVFAAVAPCAAAARRQQGEVKPKPVFHLAGEKDPLVLFAWQRETIEQVRELNQCDEGKPWEKWCTWYASKTGNPVVTCIHPGGHELPDVALPLIVKFFKQQAKP